MGTSPAPANATEAIRNVVVMLLMSPRFANHLELAGTPISGREDYLALDPYEIASRLSYTFWQTLPDDALLARGRGRLAGDRRRLRHPARSRVRRPAHARHHLAVLERVDAASNRSPASRPSAPRSWRWPRARTSASPATTTGATWCARSATSPTSTPGRSTGTLARPHDVGPVGHALGRSRPPLRRAGLERQRRLSRASPTAAARGLLQRAALLVVQPGDRPTRSTAARSSGASILCDSLPQPDPNSLPPGSLDPPPPSTAMTTRQRFAAKVEGNGLCQTCHASFSNLGYVMESFDALGRFRTMEKVFDEQTGALLATLPIDTTRGAAGDRRRHAPGQRPRRAEPAHDRERQGRGLPVGELLPLCAAPRSDRATAPTPARTRRCAAASRRAARWPPRSAASPAAPSFRQHKVGAP